MVASTGIGDALGTRLARWSRGQRKATMVGSVGLLFATCTAGNNLAHVGLVFPVLLMLLRSISADRRYLLASRADDGHGQPRRRRTPWATSGPRDASAQAISRASTAYLVRALPLAIITGGGTSGRVHRPYSPPLARVRVRSPFSV